MVAVKMVPIIGTDPEIISLTEGEIGIAELIDHPLIVPLYDCLEANGCLCVVEEFAQGGSFARYVERHRVLPEVQCRFYFLQMLSIVEYLHKTVHVLHRDLKLQNLLLDSNNNLRLTDFGLSIVLDGDEQLLERCGTPTYMAPELVTGSPYGYPADIWALGVCLYEMCVGRLPWQEADDIVALFTRIVHEPPAFPQSLNPLLKGLIEEMLCKDAERRISLDAVLAHEWVRGVTPAPNFAALKMRDSIDTEILKQMQYLSVDMSKILSDLDQNAFTEATTCYRILKRQKLTKEMQWYSKFLEDPLAMTKRLSTISSTCQIVVPRIRKDGQSHGPPKQVLVKRESSDKPQKSPAWISCALSVSEIGLTPPGRLFD
jgi:serine/threonine protein kinase